MFSFFHLRCSRFLFSDLQSRKCKGVGFARFESQKSALAAINSLTGTTVDGGIMPLIVKYADTTSDKVRKAMAAGYGNMQQGMNFTTRFQGRQGFNGKQKHSATSND